MSYLTDLGQTIEKLAENGDLVRVQSVVDPVHELAGVAFKFEGKETVLFEAVKGHRWPVFVGLYWNRPNLSRLFNIKTTLGPFWSLLWELCRSVPS